MKRYIGISFAVLIIALMAQPLFAASHNDDPSYSKIDGVFYSDPTIDCENLHNSEACELFRATESYSIRDAISFADCSVNCDELFENESCHVYRQSHPCETIPYNETVASID